MAVVVVGIKAINYLVLVGVSRVGMTIKNRNDGALAFRKRKT